MTPDSTNGGAAIGRAAKARAAKARAAKGQAQPAGENADTAREAAAEAVGRFLDAHPEIGSLDAIFIDVSGVVRGKRYPREDAGKLFKDGLQIPYSALMLDVTGESLDPLGYGFSDGDPDGNAYPVVETLAPVPWAERPRGQVLMSLCDEAGAPSLMDPRSSAIRALDKLAARGLRPMVAFELEFYLLDPDRGPDGRPQPAIAPASGRRETDGQVYSIKGLDDFDPFFAAVEEATLLQGIPASVATAEYAPGQFEINLRHLPDALTAADHCGLLRYLIERIADRQGMQASFMSKPFPELTGNGMHLHLSLLDEAGCNVFDDGSALGSESLRHAVGGLAAALPESMAIFAANLNAYRRFGPNLFVPVAKSWGANNRSFAFRIPAGPAEARRIEHRVAGADANPYLVLAAIAAAIDHGLEHKLDPGPVWRGNATERVDPDIPFTLPAALDRLERGEILRQALDPTYLKLYVEAKRLEYERFLSHVSSREYDWYL